MNKFFATKVTYVKLMENGLQKKVTESYLIDALSYAEAEARIIEEVKPYIEGEFTVSDIKKSRISDVFVDQKSELYYKATIAFITLNEKSGAEKRTKSKMIVMANTLQDAVLRIKNEMDKTMSDYVITGIEEIPILDYFQYNDESGNDGKEE